MLNSNGILLRTEIYNLTLVKELSLHKFISLRGGHLEFRPNGLKYCNTYLNVTDKKSLSQDALDLAQKWRSEVLRMDAKGNAFIQAIRDNVVACSEELEELVKRHGRN
jgi:hypothetical protein